MRNRHFGQDVVQIQIYCPVPDLLGARAGSPEPDGKPIL